MSPDPWTVAGFVAMAVGWAVTQWVSYETARRAQRAAERAPRRVTNASATTLVLAKLGTWAAATRASFHCIARIVDAF